MNNAVIYEATPEQQGWLPLGNRTWRKPDGTSYRFPPPPSREVVIVYRRLKPDEILDLVAR